MWNAARGDGLAPCRSDFNPAEHAVILPSLPMVRTARTLADFRFSVYGTTLAERFSDDRTGKRFAEITRFENFDDVMQGYWQVYETATPDLLRSRVVSTERAHAGYDRLLLPLLSDDAEPDTRPSHVVGAIHFYPRA